MTRLELSQQFAQNLEIERFRLDITQKQMADKLEVSLSTYKRIITCETEKIDLNLVYRLYKVTGKSIYEFLGITDDYLRTQKKVRELSKAQLTYIDALVDFEKSFAEGKEDSDDYITVYIPTGNMEDGMIYDSANVKKINISSYRKKYGNLISCGLLITSNHLHPVYHKDDILLLSRRPIRDGDTGIFFDKEKGCVYIRKFYQTSPCRLEPISGYGETFYVDGNDEKDMNRWIKFGIVLSKIR